MLDLTKTIKINDHFEITYARILFVSFITLFEILAIICFNNWIITPAVFFIMGNMVFSFSKKPIDEEIKDLEEEIHENQLTILKQQGLIFMLEEKLSKIGD